MAYRHPFPTVENEKADQILRLRPTERGVVRAERCPRFVVEPRRVTELEREAMRLRRDGEEFFQAPGVLLEIRRQLHEHRADLVAERLRSFADQ